jgi:hypothetical protein
MLTIQPRPTTAHAGQHQLRHAQEAEHVGLEGVL